MGILLGYKDGSAISTALSRGTNDTGYKFKNKVYTFLTNEMNIQLPINVSKKNIKHSVPSADRKELLKWFNDFDLKQFAHENNFNPAELSRRASISPSVAWELLNTPSKTGPNTSTLKTNTRDEMVYVFDKADGTQDHVLVTEKVTDSKGETTTNQSTSDKTAPVSIKVTYKLNGVETKPEDMIGKSGKVTIRYDYTNNEKKNITVNGKSQIAYVPFTMITGTLLPTDKFSNVEVTNGKVSKVGDNIIALGMAMPGLKDTLNLKFDGESLDMDIPEYFEISADVEDFELDMSMSVATTSTLNDIDTDDFSLAKLEDE